jgi:hypothetical protein
MKIGKKVILGFTAVMGISMFNATSTKAVELKQIQISEDSQRQDRTHQVTNYDILSRRLLRTNGFSLPSFDVYDPITRDYGTELNIDLSQIDDCFAGNALKPKAEDDLRETLDKIFPKVIVALDNAIIPPSVYFFDLPSDQTYGSSKRCRSK